VCNEQLVVFDAALEDVTILGDCICDLGKVLVDDQVTGCDNLELFCKILDCLEKVAEVLQVEHFGLESFAIWSLVRFFICLQRSTSPVSMSLKEPMMGAGVMKKIMRLLGVSLTHAFWKLKL
jgi:hypothetical protein